MGVHGRRPSTRQGQKQHLDQGCSLQDRENVTICGLNSPSVVPFLAELARTHSDLGRGGSLGQLQEPGWWL